MNKRGNAQDIMWIAIVLFTVAIGVLIVIFVGHNVVGQVKTIGVVANNTQAVSVLNNSQAAMDYSDYIYLGGFIGFFISLIVFAYFIGGYPVMSVIYFILLIIFGFISVILQNVWTYLIARPTFVATITAIPITNFIMLHLAYFMIIFGLISMTVMYSKSSG